MNRTTNGKMDDASILGPLLEAVGQAGYRVRDLGGQARNVAIEAAREYARRAVELAAEGAEPLANLVRSTIADRFGKVDPTRQGREILDSIRGRLEAAREQLAPFESRVQGGLEALRRRIDVAGAAEVSALRRRVEALEKRLGESRRAA